MTEEQKAAETAQASSEQAQGGGEVPSSQADANVTSEARKPSAEEILEKTQSELRELKILSARQSEELGVLRAELTKGSFSQPVHQSMPTYQAPVQQPTTTTGYPKYDDMFYEDPNKPFLTVEERAAQKGKQMALAEMNAMLARQRYIDDFYKTHRDLDNDAGRIIVDAVADKVKDDLIRLPADERAKYVAQKAREMLRLTPASQGGQILQNRPTTLEGGSVISSQAQKPQEEKFPSFVEQIKRKSQLV